MRKKIIIELLKNSKFKDEDLILAISKIYNEELLIDLILSKRIDSNIEVSQEIKEELVNKLSSPKYLKNNNKTKLMIK